MRKNPVLYAVRKLLVFLLSVWLLSLLVFCMARLSPGDPLSAYYGERLEKMSVAEKQQARQRLGLDKPLLEQYGIWLKNALKGDFGISYKYKQPVMEVISAPWQHTAAGRPGVYVYFRRCAGTGPFVRMV